MVPMAYTLESNNVNFFKEEPFCYSFSIIFLLYFSNLDLISLVKNVFKWSYSLTYPYRSNTSYYSSKILCMSCYLLFQVIRMHILYLGRSDLRKKNILCLYSNYFNTYSFLILFFFNINYLEIKGDHFLLGLEIMFCCFIISGYDYRSICSNNRYNYINILIQPGQLHI